MSSFADPLSGAAPHDSSQPQLPPQLRPLLHSTTHVPTPPPPGTRLQRPRFMRANTSPVAASTDPPPPSPTQPQRPQPQPLQLDLQAAIQSEYPTRSISTSVLAPFLPSTPSGLTASNSPSATASRSSITESLREHRWSKGLTLNWVAGLSSGQYSEGFESHPTSSSATSSSRSSQKSIQRRKSEGTGLRMAKSGESAGSAVGNASLCMARVSIAGESISRGALPGIETSVDQLKVSEARTRRVSDSGNVSFSSRLSGTSLAERLSGFAQTVRGFNRPSLTGYVTPGLTAESSCSTPGTAVGSPFDPRSARDFESNSSHPMSFNSSGQGKGFESWEEFMYHYRRGLFSCDSIIPRPTCEAQFPPYPEYARDKKAALPPYLAAPLPPSEEKRLRALYSFQILDTGSDPNFQRIAQLVATVLGVQGCMICLVDYDMVWVKGNYQAENMHCRREDSLSGHAILRPSDDPLVVMDTTQDWRFCRLPGVIGDAAIRFYAGAALTTSDGLNIGSLCVIDNKPRTSFSGTERRLLTDFSSVVMREMELWNDQVQLCSRNRMMRDITQWVRSCLDVTIGQSSSTWETQSPHLVPSASAHPLDPQPQPLPTPSHSTVSDTFDGSQTSGQDTSFAASFPDLMAPTPSNSLPQPIVSPLLDPALPTPSGSPTLPSSGLGRHPGMVCSGSTLSQENAPLQERAFPSACSMIQTTMNVDAVYLVQATTGKSAVQPAGSPVSWNYLDAAGRPKGAVGVVNGGEAVDSGPQLTLSCLGSSKKSDPCPCPPSDGKAPRDRREGPSLVCTEDGCRPHRLGDSLWNAIEPEWERDLPLIKDVLGCIRVESSQPLASPGQSRLYSTCTQGSEGMDGDWFGTGAKSRRLQCHTFQGTLPALSPESNSPYHSCVVMPILGPLSSALVQTTNDQPWAYFVILSSSRTKQFSLHERIYLRNFGSCLITEVLKRKIEVADKAKGAFIKSISHELRTPLHIILGILELLYANPEEPLSATQMAMVASAEASGKGLIDTINNIIDLAELDPDNNVDQPTFQSKVLNQASCSSDMRVEEVDIRELCEQVAGGIAKSTVDKNVVVVSSWTKPNLASYAGPASSSFAMPPGPGGHGSIEIPGPVVSESMGDYMSSSESVCDTSGPKSHSDLKPALELLVAMDEPDRGPDQDTPWKFKLNILVVKRILTQLLENAIKFTHSGFVEISAVSPPLESIPLKPPHPEARPILFTVRDTGKGISPEFVQAHLFQRFTQEDPLQVGTGLGLALVKLLVENLGGWLEIWSEGIEGKGCVVKVLIWAVPAAVQVPSLKDMEGPWQGKSSRFYTGEPSPSSDRLWTIVGERLMASDLRMNVERCHNQDFSPEEMLKDLADQSRCELLVINDDLSRLDAYLGYWSDDHQHSKTNPEAPSTTPIPLLMLSSLSNEKMVRKKVDVYHEARARGSDTAAATVVIMTKPVGPLKLVQCLQDCFSPTNGLYRDQLSRDGSTTLAHMMTEVQHARSPLLRSATVPHITTASPGGHERRLLSSFKFPGPSGGDSSILIPPHSPGGLVMPSRNSYVARSRMASVDQEAADSDELARPGVMDGDSTQEWKGASSKAAVDEQAAVGSCEKATPEGPKPRPVPRSIRNYMSQRNLLSKKGSLSSVGKESTSVSASDKGNVPESILEIAATAPDVRVLIVEDNITNRMILRTFLKKRGISVVEAENGKLGVERFQEEVWRRQGKKGFEFVLMDLQMPIMDGNLATKRIREFEQSMVKQHGLSTPDSGTESSAGPVWILEKKADESDGAEGESVGEGMSCSHEGDKDKQTQEQQTQAACDGLRGYRPTVIFALTGLAGEEDKRLAFECGVDGYLVKPISLKTLGALLTNCHPDRAQRPSSFKESNP